MSTLGGRTGWEVHPMARLPLHNDHCRICEEYRVHQAIMDKENADRVAENMERVWGCQRCGELIMETKKLREKHQEAQAEIDELKKQVEMLKRSAETPERETQRARSPEEPGDPSLNMSKEGHGQLVPGPAPTPSELTTSAVIISPNLPVPTRRVGRADIVGFGLNGVYILRNSDFTQPKTLNLEIRGFSDSADWKVSFDVRLVGDTTGDGLADIIGFGPGGVYVSRNTGTSFSPPTRVLTGFGRNGNWHNWTGRYVADLRGKGYVDIIGFSSGQISVSLNNGDGTFTSPRGSYHSFSGVQPFLADVNGDGILDIVTFSQDQVCVSLGQGNGLFAERKVALSCTFPTDGTSRTLGDLTGDGKPDIVELGSSGVYVALNKGDGTFQTFKLGLHYFNTVAFGCKAQKHFVADITGNGLGDILALSSVGVWVAIGNGDGTFQPPNLVTKEFGDGSRWQVSSHPTFVVDLTGNGAADILGFGGDGVWVWYNDGKGSFGQPQRITQQFSTEFGWNMNNSVRLVANLGSM